MVEAGAAASRNLKFTPDRVSRRTRRREETALGVNYLMSTRQRIPEFRSLRGRRTVFGLALLLPDLPGPHRFLALLRDEAVIQPSGRFHADESNTFQQH